jgi:hybrid cluster-associated redox disulfide protein
MDKMEIKPNTNVAEALRMSKKVVDVFKNYNLDCITCKGVVEETIEKAAFHNGLTLDVFLKDLNEALK